jgi:hypothetical protein
MNVKNRQPFVQSPYELFHLGLRPGERRSADHPRLLGATIARGVQQLTFPECWPY